ncbi:MAG: acetoin utilization protein AcuC [Chloroflexota bacterium]|nr:MAG: acetoin utilization protein AcuC [Chloroflexota bacterium]
MLDHESLIVYHDDFLRYDFGSQHPLRPERLVLGLELLEDLGVWDRATETLSPLPASGAQLELAHAPAYVRAVQSASRARLDPSDLKRVGLWHGDTPAFPGVHEVASMVTGGTADAVRMIMDGSIDHAFNPGGGWHHALRERASGFCVYNDPAVAAAIAAKEYDAGVLYADFDCHHGDGVQWIFYNNPRVTTVSFHESGRFLFPGTGGVQEVGSGAGHGHSVNVPFAPFTQDDSWLEAVEAVLPALMDRHRPDLLITAHGADTHILDPLTHLSLTTRSFARQAEIAHELAHTYSRGRWLAVGSGGYDWRRVVPRSWAIVWAEMTGRDLPDCLPPQWVKRYNTSAEEPLPARMEDDEELSRPLPRKAETERWNRTVLDDVREAFDRPGSH